MATSVTTGPEVMRGGFAAVLFAAIGFVWVRYGIPPMHRWMFGDSNRWWERRSAKVWNYGLLGIVGIGGAIAMIVGFIAWATGSTFH